MIILQQVYGQHKIDVLGGEVMGGVRGEMDIDFDLVAWLEITK